MCAKTITEQYDVSHKSITARKLFKIYPEIKKILLAWKVMGSKLFTATHWQCERGSN